MAGYGIDADATTLDLLRFRELLAHARDAADYGEESAAAKLYLNGAHQQAVAVLAQTVALHQGSGEPTDG
ncbi:hypothetical protein ACFXAF_18005 [Kitasatospora sp. NPDC059463]|uniref:hypothetical protein n=1 Tax=unclassified Kitasatospora TaxID=2633591 RepID=UPI00368D14C9